MHCFLPMPSRTVDLSMSPSTFPLTIVHPITEQPGDSIGPYKLLQQIGEGGMGVVYMAEQTEPVERRVALKIIKPGMDSQQVIARFEAERQALAMMDHPNIAKVLDAGTTESGRPYFVMELVKGMPVTQYCDEQQLTPRQRLELFLPICQAVQHAHQKGVIHRDLKPSNILIALYDDEAVPKIIDFGVAKAISQRLTEKTVFTQYGQIVGTIEYMSPEQAKFNQLDVDTRSDVYSLGVLLYELLTGNTPFDKQRLRSAAFDELLRIIREEEPPRPSIRLSTCETLPSIAASRHIEPHKLSTLVRGELDWIVMKALEKDRSRRYESASSFAADVQHYLNDEAVIACPPSASYRFRKFARRNRVFIGTTVAIAASLIAGIVGTSWQAYQANRQAARAEQAETRANQLFQEEKAARREAEEASAVRNAVGEFLVADLLGQANVANQTGTQEGRDPDIKVRTLLDRASQTIDERFSTRPQVAAAIHHIIGTTYQALGIYHEAEKHLQRARELRVDVLGEEHNETLETESQLAYAMMSMGRLDEAETLHRNVLEIRKRTLGDEHLDTLGSMTNLATTLEHLGRDREAESLNRKALETATRKLGFEHSVTLSSANNLANSLLGQGRYAEAEKWFKEVLETRKRVLGSDHPFTIGSQYNLGHVHLLQGLFTEAETEFREVLENAKHIWGPEHPDTLNAMMGLAVTLGRQGQYSEALTLEREILAIQQRVIGPEHPATLDAMGNLASTLDSLGQYPEAETLQREVVEIKQRVLGTEHPSTLIARLNLAVTLHHQRQYAEAEQRYREVLEIQTRRLGSEHPDTLKSTKLLAALLRDRAKFAEAESLERDVLQKETKLLGPEHPETLATMGLLAVALMDQGRQEEAEAILHKLLDIQRRTLGEEHPLTLNSTYNLANLYYDLSRYDEAEQLYQKALEIQQRTLGNDHPETLDSMNNLAAVYRAQGRYADSEKLHQQTLELRRRTLGEEHPSTLKSMHNLANVLEQMGHWDAAIKLNQQIVQIDPNNAWPHRRLGYAQEKTGDRKAAATTFREALKLDSSNDWTWNSMARVTKATGGHEAVIETFSELIDSGVADVSAYRHRSQAYEKLGQSAEAIADRRHIVELYRQSLAESEAQIQTRESFGTAWRDLGMVLRRNDQLDESESAYREGLKVWQELMEEFPENQRYRDLLGDLYRQLGNVLNTDGKCAEALTCYEKALELAPDSHWSHYAMAGFRLYARDLAFRDPEQAARHAARAVELKPKSRDSHRHLGEARYRLQDWAGAIESWEKAIELGRPADARNAFQLAICYGHLNDQEKGREWYAKAVTLMEKQTTPNDGLVELRKQAAEQLETSTPQTVKN